MVGNERRYRRDIEVESVSDFISYVLKQKNKNGFFCYRGQACEAWRPEPSLHRQRKNADVERQSLTELVNEIPDDFQKDVTCFQRLMHSQHYVLPTRLLDVTMNPLVALFLRVVTKNKKIRMALFMYLTFHIGHESYSSQLWANRSYCNLVTVKSGCICWLSVQ